MEFFKYATLIVFIIMGAEVWKYHIKNKKANNQQDDELKQKLDRLEQLEKRIQALEKIVTDPSETLRREFDNLKTADSSHKN
ncbi:hypothetical protein [Pleionea mediterranea]|jgi:uncharacterized protein YcbX|uniref:Phage shock protein B n=1 Tax=Pleionea mediterranea TaxID=523701 RepID=A0A316G274_9GAMM|nr:hypothetical protein [Pleionea mediterranea]PWK53996.1 hypothetical protein C8D97_102388 [Pleionea mediterranea]